MCNAKHSYGTVAEIPFSGYGYKLFTAKEKYGVNLLLSLFGDRPYPLSENGKTVKWCEREPGDGFCFFLDKSEAERLLSVLQDERRRMNSQFGVDVCTYKNAVIRRIKYSGGIEVHEEDNITRGHVFSVALCTEFSVPQQQKYKLGGISDHS